MNKLNLILIIIIFSITHCKLNKPIKSHGIHDLEKKNNKLMINKTNKNDIFEILGPPSTQSYFDNNKFIFIENKTTSSRFLKLGKKEIIVNNVLVLEIDNRGILKKKSFFNKNDLKKINFTELYTEVDYDLSNSILQDSLTTIKTKINDPLGKKRGSATINK